MSREYLAPGPAAVDPDGPRPEVLSSREVFAGKIINVRVDEIALSGGRTSTRETDGSGATGAGPINCVNSWVSCSRVGFILSAWPPGSGACP